jgi:hypothetical protein
MLDPQRERLAETASITAINNWSDGLIVLERLLDDSIVYKDVSKRNLILTNINNFMINATNPLRKLEENIDDVNSRIKTIKTNYIKNSDKINIFVVTMTNIINFDYTVDNTNQLDEKTRSLIKNIIDIKKKNNAYTTLSKIIQIYTRDPQQLSNDAMKDEVESNKNNK